MNPGDLIVHISDYDRVGMLLKKVRENDPNHYYFVYFPDKGIRYVPLHSMRKIN